MLKLIAFISIIYISYKLYKLSKKIKNNLDNSNIIELKKDKDWKYEKDNNI